MPIVTMAVEPLVQIYVYSVFLEVNILLTALHSKCGYKMAHKFVFFRNS